MNDRARWDAKWSAGAERAPAAPDPFVLTALERLGPGEGRPALDLAAGAGRHALELARRGWRVTAWDVSPVGLDLLADAAARAGRWVETRACDLLAEDPDPGRRFELVVVVDFHDPALWRRLDARVAPGGWLLLRTFTREWPGARPPLRYRLEPGVLGGGRPGFITVATEESAGRAGWLGRREGEADARAPRPPGPRR